MITVTGAALSACGRYRYRLTRGWADGPCLLFVMLNPSTADGTTDDATVRSCIRIATAKGYGGMEIVNLFAFRSRNPDRIGLRVRHPEIDFRPDDDTPLDVVGPANDEFIRCASHMADEVVVAWGGYLYIGDRDKQVMEILQKEGVTPKCLGVTKYGRPKHPLYLPTGVQLQPFELIE